MKKILFLIVISLITSTISAQDYFPVNENVKNKSSNYTAFTNAKIYVTPTQVIEKGTLLIF